MELQKIIIDTQHVSIIENGIYIYGRDEFHIIKGGNHI